SLLLLQPRRRQGLGLYQLVRPAQLAEELEITADRLPHLQFAATGLHAVAIIHPDAVALRLEDARLDEDLRVGNKAHLLDPAFAVQRDAALDQVRAIRAHEDAVIGDALDRIHHAQHRVDAPTVESPHGRKALDAAAL